MVSKLKMSGSGMTSMRTRSRLIDRLREQGIENEHVLDAILETPRHIFIDEALAHKAYEDTALPIGHKQTISQPYIVARMTELLMEVSPKKVLELGTGSGYQTAVLSQLVEQIFSIERIKPLVVKARQRSKFLGIDNVRFFHSDGNAGYVDQGPFDAILSAAAPLDVPPDLKLQLAIGGRMVLPVGDEKLQHLVQIDRTVEGFIETKIEVVNFVPMLSGIQ